MSLQQRREKEKKERQEAILEAAERMFFEKGYERTSMDQIAKTAQLSRALLYVYFKDKAAILRGITLRAGEALHLRFEAAAREADTGLERVARIGQAYYQFSKENPDYFDVLTYAASLSFGADDEHGQALKECEAGTMDIMVAALHAGLGDGSISRERIADPLETALYLRGALHGVIMLSKQELSEPGPLASFDPDRLVAHTLQMLMVSIQAR